MIMIIIILRNDDADHYQQHRSKCHGLPSSHCGSSTWFPAIRFNDEDYDNDDYDVVVDDDDDDDNDDNYDDYQH